LKLKLGLIGNAISKSRAPSLHRFLGNIHGIEISYDLFDPGTSDANALVQKIEQLTRERYDGCNITFPFKQLALDFADLPDKASALIGSTNTLKLGTQIKATNTDYTGFVRAFIQRFDVDSRGTTLILGAGGVGRAIAFGLGHVCRERIHIFDPSTARSEELCSALQSAGFDARSIVQSEIPEVSQQVTGILNCSPVGHYQTPGTPIDLSLIGNQKWAFDAVYTPIKTSFIESCWQSNIAVLSGFDLFFYQGLDAFEYWTGIKANEHEVKRAFLSESKINPAEILN